MRAMSVIKRELFLRVIVEYRNVRVSVEHGRYNYCALRLGRTQLQCPGCGACDRVAND